MLYVFYSYRFYFRQVVITSYDIVSFDAHKFLHIALVSHNSKSVKEKKLHYECMISLFLHFLFPCLRISVQWMDDLSTHVVLFTISGSLAKRAVWKRTAPNKQHKKYIYLSGPKQMKYQTFLMWIHPKNELIDTTTNRQLISVLQCS